MKKASKKGFTLIELMIVLAIIAILAMVLVPKAGIFKSQSKNAGVYTNVNTVRAYLENKVGDNFITGADAAAGVTNVKTAISTAFSGEKFKNPLTTKEEILSVTTSTGDSAPAVLVVAKNTELTLSDFKGTVVIEYDFTGKIYNVYGIDNGAAKVSETTIK